MARSPGARSPPPACRSRSAPTSRSRIADPRAGLAAAETRAARGAPPFRAEERLARDEAIAAFTRGAAYAAFSERRRGIVREGLDADLTLFDGDVAACPADALRDLRVTHTIVGGRVEHGPA